jgi:hypothetical protein
MTSFEFLEYFGPQIVFMDGRQNLKNLDFFGPQTVKITTF